SGSFLGLRNVEVLSWDYAAISQATIVPGSAIGKSFSVLFLSSPAEWEHFGVPRRISPQQLATTLATRGVNVQFGDHVPADVREPMSWSAAIVALVIALPVLIAGMVFYAQRVPAAAGNMAAVMRPDPFPRAPRPKLPRGPQRLC